jgi:formylglycine-generating enzyme required for sulfatase activity
MLRLPSFASLQLPALCSPLLTGLALGGCNAGASTNPHAQPVEVAGQSAGARSASSPLAESGAPPQRAPAPTKLATVTPSSDTVAIPAGSVEVDGKRVAVAAFELDRTEVTTSRYLLCVSAKACTPAGTDYPECNGGRAGIRGNYPINCVGITQAKAFCAWRGMRLPTEPEWQLAAGGPEARNFPWGNDVASNAWLNPEEPNPPPGPARYQLCWTGDGTDTNHKYPTETCPVGAFPTGNTPSGISDLAGNVWEWTASDQNAPDGSSMRRLKGGAWNYDPMGALTVGVKDSTVRVGTEQTPDIGFRCAK